jgi:two-component system sensor histidine kinase YesM
MGVIKKMIYLYNNASMRVKLLVSFFCVGLAIVLMTGLVANIVFANAFEKSAIETTIQAIDQANVTVDSNVKSAENIIRILSKNRQVLNLLMNADNSNIEDVTARISVGSYLATIVDSFPYFKGIALVGRNDTVFSNEMQRNILAALTQEEWYQDAVNNPSRLFIIPKPKNRGFSYYNPVSADEIIMLAMGVVDTTTNDVLGVIIIDLDTRLLLDTLDNMRVGKDGFIMIVDNDGELIYAPTNDLAYRVKQDWFLGEGTQIINKTIKGEGYQLIYSMSDYSGWKTVGVFSLNKTLEQVVSFQYILLFVMLGVLVFVSLFSVLFSSRITKPIIKLKSLIDQAEHGDLTVHFDSKYNDEVGRLGKSFNAMIDEIRHLIETIYYQQRQKRQDDIAFLQAQIKPHFLYNTFDTIHWMAKKYDAKDIIQMISALTKLYRIGLSKGSDTILLSEEIEHVRNYLIIQGTRYSDILDYEIICTADSTHLYVQKLILQPLVENAIYHGVRQSPEPGKVIVHVYEEEDTLWLKVTDNGPGISPDQLTTLNEQIQSKENPFIGYGLYNVNSRIMLRHGDDYKLVVESVVGEGTTVTIKYPKVYERGKENDV